MNLSIKNITCIGCPLGCYLEVFMEDNKVIMVKGQTCSRGEKYGVLECTNPTRILTSTVMIQGGDVKVLSVKSEKALPKDKIFACIKELKKIHLVPPVNIGDIIISNILETNVDIIATKNVKKKLE